MSIALVMPSSHLILWHPLLLSALNLSQHQGLFQWVTILIMWPKYWSFSFSIRPSNEYSGLISLKIDWFNLFTVQGTFRSLPLAPQFEGTNSLVFCLLYGPALILISDTQIKTWSITSQHLKNCPSNGSLSLPQSILPGVTTVLTSNTMDLFFLLLKCMLLGFSICYICLWVGVGCQHDVCVIHCCCCA